MTALIIILINVINYIGFTWTLVEVKSFGYTWKKYIPFYWLYYVIKMNIKKYLLIDKISKEGFDYVLNTPILCEFNIYIEMKRKYNIHYKAIKKIKQLW